jgi:uncharacterized protein YbjT (DUF2867 family)
MRYDGRPVLVIGATGFVGGRVVAALRADGYAVRCMARNPDRASGLADDGAEVVRGDLVDAEAVDRAVDGTAAVVLCFHTLSPQPRAGAEQGFVEVETVGVRNVISACRTHGVPRVLYVTSIGVAVDAPSSWLRGRAAVEGELFKSGLDVTVLRPGMIVGRGGQGFEAVVRGATRSVTVGIGSQAQRFRTIAVDDLARDLVNLIDRPESFGVAFDVGSDDVLTMKQMTALAARSVGRRPARTLVVPAALLRTAAPLIERVTRMPRGAVRGLLGDGPAVDLVGDPRPIRAVLGRKDRSFAAAVDGQVT